MLSMTGFGRGTAKCADQNCEITAELVSVNRKGLDIQVSGPREWAGIEQCCGGWIKTKFSRGRVQVQIKVETAGASALNFSWSEEALKQNLERLREFAAKENVSFDVDGTMLIELAKALRDTSKIPDWRTIEAEIGSALKDALEDIGAMRASEGKAIAADLLERIDSLEKLNTRIEEAATGAVSDYRDALVERLKQLDLDLDPDDDRVLKELAFFADRCDISEELTRLGSHLAQFRDLVAASEPCGRKMDFLCQEIYRELNTTGSKATRVEITRAVIEAKNCVEQIREQVQNVE